MKKGDQGRSVRDIDLERRHERLPGLIDKAPHLPSQLFDLVQRASAGELVIQTRHIGAEKPDPTAERRSRQTTWAILAAGLAISGSLMLGLEAPPLWRESSIGGLAALGLAAIAGLRALRS